MTFKIVICSIICIILLVIFFKKKRRTYMVGYVEPGELKELNSYPVFTPTKDRFFRSKSGIIDLKKHPELKRLKILGTNDEVLVEFNRVVSELENGLEPGSKIVVIKFVDNYDKTKSFGVLYLRTFESKIEVDSDDLVNEGKEYLISTSWTEPGETEVHIDTVNENQFLGVVRYESI